MEWLPAAVVFVAVFALGVIVAWRDGDWCIARSRERTFSRPCGSIVCVECDREESEWKARGHWR